MGDFVNLHPYVQVAIIACGTFILWKFIDRLMGD